MPEPTQTQSPESRPPAPLRAPNNATALEEITERADTVWTRGSGKPVAVETAARRELKGPRGRIAIIDGCRTPFIKAGTEFQNMDVIDLASIPTAELLARTGIDPELIDLSVFGVVVPALHAPNLGREVVFRTSMPMRIPGVTVNLACASSTRAVTFGAEAILTGEADVVLAGGAESMSRGPYWMPGARWGARMGDAAMIDATVGSLTDPFDAIHMGMTAENLADSHAISREDQDEFACTSHRRAQAATEAGRFRDEVIPVPIKSKRETIDFTRDEHIRNDISAEALAKLRPAFKKDGTVTAGNAAGSSPGPPAASSPSSWASGRCPPCARRSNAPAARSRTSTSSSSTRPSPPSRSR
jgi:acetyl-CoA C-acetyltransferase